MLKRKCLSIQRLCLSRSLLDKRGLTFIALAVVVFVGMDLALVFHRRSSLLNDADSPRAVLLGTVRPPEGEEDALANGTTVLTGRVKRLLLDDRDFVLSLADRLRERVREGAPPNNKTGDGAGRTAGAKVLIHTMARSGSSLLGQLLSLPVTSTYVFEPLRAIRWTDSALEHWGREDVGQIAPTMRGVFNCERESLDRISKSQLNEGLDLSKCLNAHPLVVKTIRLRHDKFSEWSSTADLGDVKVVHLVRDPRARYFSLRRNMRDFVKAVGAFDDSCRWEMEDLRIRELLPSENFYLLRYEDLVSDLVDHTRRLYAFMGVDFGEREAALVRRHATEGDDTDDKRKKNQYYSTYRSKGFDRNLWMKGLSQSNITAVEETCAQVLSAFGYERYRPNRGEQG